MKKRIFIAAIIFVATSILGCGPKPRVITEPLTMADLKREPMSAVAFSEYMSGVVSELDEKYDLALTYYTAALSHAPNNYDIRIALANLRMGMRDYDKAWELLSPLDDLDPDGVLLKAECQRALGHWDQAVKYYSLAEKLAPEEAAPYWYLGNYYKQTGDLPKAIQQFDRIAALNGNAQIYNELAQLRMAINDTAAAIKSYQISLETDPSLANKDAYLNLGRLLRFTGRNDSALTIVREYLTLDSSSLPAQLQLVDLLVVTKQKQLALQKIEELGKTYSGVPRLQGQLGLYCLQFDELAKAKSFFENQIATDKSDFLPQFYLGRIALSESNLEKAKGYFWKVVDLADTLPDGWINLAEIYRFQDSMTLAVDILKEGLDRVTIGKQDIQTFLARYFVQMEQYQGAINILKEMVDSTTKDVSLLFTLASAYERTGEFDKSAATFERLLRIDSLFHPALNYLGYMYADKGIHLQESRAMIEKALAQDSANPAYLDSYGWVLFKLGDLSQAEKYIKRSLDLLQTGDATIYDHLAEIYYAQGRRAEARQTWEKALALDPDNAMIKEKLNR